MAGLDRFSQSRMLATTAPTTPTSVAMMVIDSHSHTWVSPTRCPEYPFHQGVAAEDADPSEYERALCCCFGEEGGGPRADGKPTIPVGPRNRRR